VEDESGEARLLCGFAKRDFLAGGLAGIGVATRLQPAVELRVMKQERAGAVFGDDHGAPGEVTFADAAIERVGVPGHEGADPGEVSGLVFVLGLVPGQRFGQCHGPHSTLRPELKRAGGRCHTRVFRGHETMDIVAINSERTLFVSGEIEDWETVQGHAIDTIVDMDGDVDPASGRAQPAALRLTAGLTRC